MRLSCAGLTLCLIMVVGCTTLQKPSQSYAIETHRANITTTPNLSVRTTSTLLSSGYNQVDCLAEFDTCIQEVKAGFLGHHHSKSALVLLAELYYAYARHLNSQPHCQSIVPTPIDPYYSNAVPSDHELQEKTTAYHACRHAYKTALYHSINHSYGYLFYDPLTNQPTNTPFVDEDTIKAHDLYHVASKALIDDIYQQKQKIFYPTTTLKPTTHATQHTPFGQRLLNRYQQDNHIINLYIADDPYYDSLLNLHPDSNRPLSTLVSVYDKQLAKLDITSTRSGIGVGYVGTLHETPSQTTPATIEDASLHTIAYLDSDASERIHPMGHIVMTALVKPVGNTLDEILHSQESDIHFFNPYNTQNIELFGNTYSLFANFSAGYALWLSQTPLQKAGLLALLNKEQTALPELFMLEPYNPNKKVVIMIHGLASSPATWVNFTNNLLSDPVLRQHYQVWQIFYSTNLPMLENRYQIQRLIEHAYHISDPQGNTPSSRNSILIGHSMGGVLSRMMVSDDTLLPALEALTINSSSQHTSSNNQRIIKKLLAQRYQQEFSNRFVLRSLPQVDTAIFISAPFRGTDYADRWFTRLARRVVRLPLDLTQTVTGAITTLGDDPHTNPINALYLQNGASQLSDKSTFMALTADITISPNVRYYSIMGNRYGNSNKTHTNQGDIAGTTISDGIVPYQSSHLTGAERETIITGGHSIHENPKTIRELRKILHDHLATLPKADQKIIATP